MTSLFLSVGMSYSFMGDGGCLVLKSIVRFCFIWNYYCYGSTLKPLMYYCYFSSDGPPMIATQFFLSTANLELVELF